MRTLRHNVNVLPGHPYTAEVVSLDGTPRIYVTDGGTFVGEFPSVEAVARAGIDLSLLTIKERAA